MFGLKLHMQKNTELDRCQVQIHTDTHTNTIDQKGHLELGVGHFWESI